MPTRFSGHYFFRVLALFATVVIIICVLEVSLNRPFGAKRHFRYFYDRLKPFVPGKENQTVEYAAEQREPSAGQSTESPALQKWNFLQYRLPHNTTILGKPFNMSQSTVNIVRTILGTETFKRKPIKLDSVETFPEIVAVTGSSSNHFDEHKGHIESFRSYYPGVKLIFYDLGLTASEVKQVLEQAGIEYRKFDFTRYPAHVRNLYNYAWKALIVQHLLAEFDGVMWFDTSIKFQRNITYLKERMVRFKTGFQYYVSTTGHSIVTATHPRMMEYFPMERSGAVSNMFQGGAIIVLNTAEVQNNILKWMCVCVLNVDCISPPGSTLFCNFNFPREKFGGCHRYDQSLLSILVSNTYRYEKERYTFGEGDFLAVVDRG